ncbi:hypothetical protein BTW10_04780 [Chromohalobacter japonicus]|uniref:Type I restriction modification DNA specificity domain-containing protein n=2 Tax=Chromohalobacter TaxID=42054 RepID=A0A1Q8TEX9_9GAMM|nr:MULTISPECIES: restriction endonuclease subunit S [Chromohalobacter]MCK2045887.1 restriction endonuclease subunit S [Chromohalobacter moromii]MCT8505689.1 restriction endonuclease subunit S [Chromohalobacter moromii]OLO12224.1 hypothetical protein BTW10_04780 [Chromohalobacter japonicus]
MFEEIPEGWEVVSVRELAACHFSGPSPTCEERNVQSSQEWGVLKTTAVKWSGYNDLAHKTLPKSYWGIEHLEIKKSDILVTKAGPRHRVGVVAYVPEIQSQLIPSGKMICLRLKDEYQDADVIAALLSQEIPQKYLDDRTTGMAESQLNFTNSVFLNAEILLPPKPERVLISRIFSAIDTQIRHTEAIIAKLQQVKQGLLHDLLTRGIDENGQLRPPRDQAPELYKDSPLGWIPREWGLGMLKDWLRSNPKNGYSPLEASEKTGLSMLGLGCLTLDGFEARQLKNAPKNDPRIWSAELKEGDFLISRANTRETVGLVGRYQEVGQPCFYPDLMMRLRFNEMCLAEYMECILSSPSVRRQIKAAASGTSESMVKISSSIVKSLILAIAPHEEQIKIVDMLSKHQYKLRNEKKLLMKLEVQKKGLMDDLLTGRIRVTELVDQQQHAS